MKRKNKLASSLVVVNGMPLPLSVREVVTDGSGEALVTQPDKRLQKEPFCVGVV